MSFGEPMWLLLAPPLALLWWRTKSASPAVAWLRALLLALVVVALAEPRIVRERRGGTVIVVADRSDSMTAGAEDRHREVIGLLREAMGDRDRLGVVGFGARAVVESAPGSAQGDLFALEMDGSASNLGSAVRTALTLVASGEPARVVVLSDGVATDSTVGVGALAAAAGVAIDYRWMGEARGGDLAIGDLVAPASVGAGEAFLVHATVESPRAQRVSYELARGGTVIARGEAEVGAGRSTLTFRDAATAGAVMDYRLTVSRPDDDPVGENNRARALVGVREVAPLLLVTETPGRGLAALLAASGLTVDARAPSEVNPAIESLAQYAGVILENVAAQDLGREAAENLALLVKERGTGLLMTGGRRSFAAGGYYGSVLEPVLPVSLELRSEFRKFSVAIVVALDRSGSMAVPVPGGRTKMQLAGIASARVAEMLSPIDQFGAIATDSQSEIVLPLMSASEAAQKSGRLRSLQAGGGGIYVYNSLVAASRMIQEAKAGARHIVLFADAADAEEPGEYIALLERLREADITVTAVGLGTEGDVDANFLKDIAERGGGRVFFTTDAAMLPELFSQDAVAVARSAMVDVPTALRATGELRVLLGGDFGELPPAGGYNPTFLREGASLGASSVDEFGAPFVAFWNVGLGRAAAFTGEVDGRFTGAWREWEALGRFWSGMGRYLVGDRAGRSTGAVARQSVDRGVVRVELYVDPERASEVRSPTVRVLRRSALGETTVERVALAFDSGDRMSAEIALAGEDIVVPTIDFGDGRSEALAPAALAYSPEYRPVDGAEGRLVLSSMARRTGGMERADIESVWADMAPVRRAVSLTGWVLGLALLTLLAEVAERRTGMLTHGLKRRALGAAPAGAEAREERGRPVRAAKGAKVAKPAREAKPGPARAEAPSEPEGGVLGALRDLDRSKRPK